MGRVSQYLERRALQTAIPGEREAPSLPKGQGSGQSTKPGAGEGRVGGGVGEAPRGSRAQMLDFCFLDILLSTCEGSCVSGHMGILLVFGDQRERENFSSVQFSRSVVSDSLRPHESQHARPPCPLPTPGVHSDSHPSSQLCHPAISSSVIPFSSSPQSLPASESFPMSQCFA